MLFLHYPLHSFYIYTNIQTEPHIFICFLLALESKGIYPHQTVYNDALGLAAFPLWLFSWSREAFAQSTPGVTFISSDILEYINTNTKSKHSKINDHC